MARSPVSSPTRERPCRAVTFLEKWSNGECKPASKWIKADRRNSLVPRDSKRWRDLYRGRAAVEREFGRLKNEYGLSPLRVRGLERVALHAGLVMLARLSLALARARAVPRRRPHTLQIRVGSP
jgi:hypothetical protein